MPLGKERTAIGAGDGRVPEASPRLPKAFNCSKGSPKLSIDCFKKRKGRRGGTDASPRLPKAFHCFVRKERTAGGGGTDASPRLPKAFNCFVRKERMAGEGETDASPRLKLI